MEKIVSKKVMVSRNEAAMMFGCSPGTLANLLSQNRGPRAYRVGRRILYKVKDLQDYFTATPILTTDSLSEEQR